MSFIGIPLSCVLAMTLASGVVGGQIGASSQGTAGTYDPGVKEIASKQRALPSLRS